MLNKLVIIVEKDRGIFLGNYNNVAVFSKHDFLESTRAYGFKSKAAAESFVEEFLPQLKETTEYIDIPTDDFMHVGVVDIIKAGYPHYTEEMFMNLETTPTIH